jgi:ketosteroid isomerase-like protein
MTLEQQIKEIDAEFSETFNRGDMDALKTMHEDNAMMMAPDSPASVGGSEAVVQQYQEMWDAGWRNISLSTVEIGSDGNLAYHVGRAEFDVPTNEGSPKRIAAKYVDIYKRGEDGLWKVHLTCYNLDEPLPE